MKLHEVKKHNPTSSQFWQEYVGQTDVNVSAMNLKSLVGCPQIIDGTFLCGDNDLMSLDGGPRYVEHAFKCDYNRLTSLQHAPEHVGGRFDCSNNNITNLKDIHETIKFIGKSFICLNNPIESNILGLALIKGIQGIRFDFPGHVDNIFRTVIVKTKDPAQRVILFQDALIDAGYEKLARI